MNAVKIERSAVFILFGAFCAGCIFNRPEEVQSIVKDFNLGWQGDAENRAIFVNIDHEEYGGLKIIDRTVTDVGFNEQFIIARQKPYQTSDTIYHIIDIRDYSERFWGPEGNIYSFSSELDFQAKKAELGISQLELNAISP